MFHFLYTAPQYDINDDIRQPKYGFLSAVACVQQSSDWVRVMVGSKLLVAWAATEETATKVDSCGRQGSSDLSSLLGLARSHLVLYIKLLHA